MDSKIMSELKETLCREFLELVVFLEESLVLLLGLLGLFALLLRLLLRVAAVRLVG